MFRNFKLFFYSNQFTIFLDDLQAFQSEDDSRKHFLGELQYIDANDDTPPAVGGHRNNP